MVFGGKGRSEETKRHPKELQMSVRYQKRALDVPKRAPRASQSLKESPKRAPNTQKSSFKDLNKTCLSKGTGSAIKSKKLQSMLKNV